MRERDGGWELRETRGEKEGFLFEGQEIKEIVKLLQTRKDK